MGTHEVSFFKTICYLFFKQNLKTVRITTYQRINLPLSSGKKETLMLLDLVTLVHTVSQSVLLWHYPLYLITGIFLINVKNCFYTHTVPVCCTALCGK
jgi:hypothetical protein